MGNLNSHGALAAAELAFYVPALLVGIVICIKHGFGKSTGWYYLVVLSLLRLIGSSCTLYMQTQNDYSSGLVETAVITSSIGTAPLVLVLLGLIERIHAQMTQKSFQPRVFTPIHLIGLAALIIAIVGGTDRSNSDPGTQKTGRDLLEAGSILFLVVYLAVALLTVLTAMRASYIPSTEKLLIIAGMAALPFVLVRIVYTIAVSFSNDPTSAFYYKSPSVWVTAFMQFAMEAIAIVLYSWAGLFTPKQASTPSYQDGSMARTRGEAMRGPRVKDQEAGYSSPQTRQSRWQRPENLGDYRPSRMIRNALRS